MIIQRFVLVVAIFAAAYALPAQTLVSNGGFEPGQPDEARGWATAYGTPELVDVGCDDPWAISMSAGEAIRQPVALMKGVTYAISLCAMGAAPKMEIHASTAPLGDPACPAGKCEAAKITASGKSTILFTPARDHAYLTISAGNAITVDNVSITVDRPRGRPAPLINADAPGAIPGQYIVLFKKGADQDDVTHLMKLAEGEKGKILAEGVQGKILFRYTSDTLGFAVRFKEKFQHSPPDVLRMNDEVLWVEADQRMLPSFVTQQPVPTNGIDRVDRRLLPLNGSFQYTETGQGVHAYVFDTGISSHAEFDNNRLAAGHTVLGGGTTDCNGHGTHVAGTLGGSTFGVAKKVTLHAVRVIDCNGIGDESAVIAGVDWLTPNKILPAVANLSISAKNMSPSLDLKIRSSIEAGITYVVAAHNRADDACLYSPARLAEAITVGATNPLSDVRYVLSNYGTCVDVFAPGTAILSAWNANTTATAVKSGTSMSAPHVAGVAALALELDPSATPLDVWNKIHANNNVSTTPNWPGIGSAGPGSPNELLHWGPLHEGYDDGDPHLTTVDGTRYDFQSAGEFVLLRGGGVEIQTRQTPVPTFTNPGPDANGLATCVSVNTALAARVGSHRVTYQPSLDGVANPKGMQVRVDGALTTLDARGLDLAGGRIVQTAVGGGIEIHFPDGTVLTAVPRWWSAQSKWFLNLHVNRTRAAEGIMGAIAQGSWLPALPNGKSAGPKPESLHQRYVDLYQTFADAWRVSQATSLFDYGADTSTRTFTDVNWPPENPPCAPRGRKPPRRVDGGARVCTGLRDERARADCLFDVTATGEREFEKLYSLSQQLRLGATTMVITSDRDTSTAGEKVAFTATVTLLAPRDSLIPAGIVQFFVDAEKTGEPVPLGRNGRATLTTAELAPGKHPVSARYIPAPETEFLASSSADRLHLVASGGGKR